jgi:hypothetical protein
MARFPAGVLAVFVFDRIFLGVALVVYLNGPIGAMKGDCLL